MYFKIYARYFKLKWSLENSYWIVNLRITQVYCFLIKGKKIIYLDTVGKCSFHISSMVTSAVLRMSPLDSV